jgi:hypothetical protein
MSGLEAFKLTRSTSGLSGASGRGAGEGCRELGRKVQEWKWAGSERSGGEVERYLRAKRAGKEELG